MIDLLHSNPFSTRKSWDLYSIQKRNVRKPPKILLNDLLGGRFPMVTKAKVYAKFKHWSRKLSLRRLETHAHTHT